MILHLFSTCRFSPPFIHLIPVKPLKLVALIREIFWDPFMVYTHLKTYECLSTTILNMQLPSVHVRYSSHFIYTYMHVYKEGRQCHLRCFNAKNVSLGSNHHEATWKKSKWWEILHINWLRHFKNINFIKDKQT